MRQRITLLVAGTTSAIVLAFVIPLALLVQTLASNRAMYTVEVQTRSATAVVASVADGPALAKAVAVYDPTDVRIAVLSPKGTAYGTLPDGLSVERMREVQRTGAAFKLSTDKHITLVTPVVNNDGTTVIAAYMDATATQSGVVSAWATLVALGTLLILISVLLARQFGGRVTKPVTDLAHVANALRAGDLTARATPDGPPETYQLGTAFNLLADRIGELVAQERESVADLGHRLRTPVTALRLDTDLIEDPAVAARLREHVDHLHRSIDAVVREARRNTRETLVRETSDVAELVSDRAAFWRPLAEDQGRTLKVFGAGAPVRVAIPAEDLREILDTLLDNVFAHTPEGAPIELRITPSAKVAAVTVADGGPGADETQLQRGASSAGSTGLGLDIVRRLAESTGGQVALRQSNLGGLAVDVVLPLAP